MTSRPIDAARPTPAEFRRLYQALVSQVPELAPRWWRRVRQAARENAVDRLRLLKAEAENRIEHDRRRRKQAVLDVLFDVIGHITGVR